MVGGEAGFVWTEGLSDKLARVPEKQRSSITLTQRLWDSPVPYTFHEDLELNAKGVILRAFDQFRLKTCIDFTVRETQDYFIHVQKLDGCFSYIGQAFLQNGQTLSIGQYCDEISTVEHEFLHALGFYHEQSRPDRDDFVTIMFNNILEGSSQNFDIANGSSAQGVPYDYMSVMHYGKNAFSNGNGFTIITTDPEFQDVIGQRQAMSPRDVEELNLRYGCNDSIAFQLFCDFSDGDMCHMTHCSRGSTKWERVTSAEGGPSSDHTNLPTGATAEDGSTPEAPTEGHFMHVSTAAGEAGDSAWLETPRIQPKREGHLQCLQFYYFHNGSADDQLNIWIREFENENDKTGFVRLMGQVTGPPTSHWRIHHVSLDPQSEFQVEFEVQKGNGSSFGGISIDDINLSEIQCPHVTIQVDEFEHLMTTSSPGTYVFSERRYSSDGYAYRFAVVMNQNYFGLRVQLLSGQYDDELAWPCLNRQVTLQVLDQTPNIQQHMSKQRSFTTDSSITTGNGTSVWDNPRNFGRAFVTEDGEEVFGGPLVGLGFFWYLDNLKSLNFLKGESAVFAFDFQDITPLIDGSSLPKAKLGPATITLKPKNPRHDTCPTRKPTTAHPTTAHPTTAHPTTAHPTTADPTIADPTTADPTTADPTTRSEMMKGLCFWVSFLVLSSTSSQGSEIIDIAEGKDITDANQNLPGDDILQVPPIQRSSITDTDFLWDSPVPYTLDEGLELNAKGVTLRAFDQFRLKTCIDFTVRETEDYFIHVQKLGGCFSYIGQAFLQNGQALSIGQYCDEISTVEHEFLHALGFYHEQSRPDRDDFVTIVFDNILEGRSHNFDIADGSSAQGVPYDYMSVMHYGKNAFSNGNGSTIITTDPEFQDVIGQRQAMSPRDVEELNLRYGCNDSIAFQLFCDFSDGDMCHMTHCSSGCAKWERVTSAEGGPSSDHTNLPTGVTAENGSTPEPPTEGHFMHVSTAAGEAGDSAWLETPRIQPKREGHLQCLQFYYFHNGSADDQLNIWIREFENENDKTGFVRLMGQVTGPPTSHWRIHHVSLDPQSEFQVEFEVQKGNGSSFGGISIDDINLSEIQCPHVTIQVDEFEHLMTTSSPGTYVFSERRYSSDGYAHRFAVVMNQNYFGLRVQLLSGQYDDELAWPCLNRQVTLQVLDQTPNIQQHMSKQRSFTTDSSITTGNGRSVWDNPRNFGLAFVTEDGEEVFGGPLVGLGFFWYLDNLKSLNFLKGESAVFAFDFQDITPLINESSLPKANLAPATIKLQPKNPRLDTCPTRTTTTAHPTTAHPTTAHPTTAHPTTAHPTTAHPTTAHPTTAHPTTAHPTTAHPTTAHPTTAHPTTAHPTTAHPTTAHPTTAHPTTAHPTTAHPTTAYPTTAHPTTAHPTTAHPTTDGSIFGFSPAMMSSPILILLSAVLLWIA
ncbi:uncharacterized protein ACB057_008878 [Neosynchiropus ocellatus]